MDNVIRTEKVYADIRVVYERTTYGSTHGDYTDIDMIAVNSLNNNLTASERDYVPEMVMESIFRSEYLNALIHAAAGTSTDL